MKTCLGDSPQMMIFQFENMIQSEEEGVEKQRLPWYNMLRCVAHGLTAIQRSTTGELWLPHCQLHKVRRLPIGAYKY